MFLQLAALDHDGIFLIRCPVMRSSLKRYWLLRYYLPIIRNSRSNNFPCQSPLFKLKGEEQSSEGGSTRWGWSKVCECLSLVSVPVLDQARSGLAPGRIWTGQKVSCSHKHQTTEFNFPELCVKCSSNANLQILSINQNMKPVALFLPGLHMLVWRNETWVFFEKDFRGNMTQ